MDAQVRTGGNPRGLVPDACQVLGDKEKERESGASSGDAETRGED